MSKDEELNLSKKMDRVLYILENDDKTGRMGLVQSVSVIRIELDALVHAHKVAKAVKRRENMIWGSVGATLLMALKWIGSTILPFLSKF